jgi:HlyD family secretion protein
MQLLKNKWVLLLLVVAAVALVVGFRMRRAPEQKYFTAKAQTSTINDVVQATGTINAVINVQVGSQVSGRIAALYVDFNSKVRKGQLVAEIDPALFQGAVLQARADLQNSRATLASAKADLVKAQATAVQTKADFARAQGLAKEGVMSPQQLDLARANAETAQAAVQAADATVQQAAAQGQQKQAALSVADTNLKYTMIHAPIDGVVVARNVDVGQTVAASLQAPTLFTIAQDLTKMQVDTQIDESDVGNMKMGQEASFRVDAYPNQTFHGRVAQVRLNPTLVQNVVTYDTVITFENPQGKLFPGMTAYVSIPVAEAQDVLAVPNSALRFKPDMKPEEMRALLAKYGVTAQSNSGHPTRAGAAESTASNRQGVAPGARGGGAPGGSGAGNASNGGAEREPRHDYAVIWKLKQDGTLEPVALRTGITDHTQTEVVQVLKGELQAGESLAIGMATSGAKAPSGPGAGVRMR